MTARRLVLVRHAKAADGAVDAERPLAARGVRDAAAVGEWLARHSLVPDRVVVSPARRARQTWEHAAAALAAAPAPILDKRIYVNRVGSLLSAIGATPPALRTVAVVGHNPSVAELTRMLEDDGADADAQEAIDRGFPTSGVAVLTVNVPWSQLAARTATLMHFTAPRG